MFFETSVDFTSFVELKSDEEVTNVNAKFERIDPKKRRLQVRLRVEISKYRAPTQKELDDASSGPEDEVVEAPVEQRIRESRRIQNVAIKLNQIL